MIGSMTCGAFQYSSFLSCVDGESRASKALVAFNRIAIEQNQERKRKHFGPISCLIFIFHRIYLSSNILIIKILKSSLYIIRMKWMKALRQKQKDIAEQLINNIFPHYHRCQGFFLVNSLQC